MKHSFQLFAILLIFLLPATVIASQKGKGEKIPPISDLMLIYHGATQRPAWTADQLAPYVFREKSGKTEWLFDGFLFLEIFDSVEKYDYDPGFGHQTAGKKQWEWLLNRYFAKGKGPDALEAVLDSLAKNGEKPVRARQVVISIPCPVNGFTDWGELDGKKLDFRNPEDQAKAACWFIDEALKKWKEKNYQHIKLNGFYWVHEDAAQSEEAIPVVKKYLESKNYKLLWIPYWGAKGKEEWKKLGFDFAWQQPNYFFATDIPKQRLTDACLFAKEHQMGLEMEFDNRVSQPEFGARFYDYIKSFEENNVWERYPVAYYEGGGAWMQMAKSNNPELKKMTETLGDIIVKRQAEADKAYNKSTNQ